MKLKYQAGTLIVNTEITKQELQAAEQFNREALTVRDEKGNALYAMKAYVTNTPELNDFSITANTVDENNDNLLVAIPQPTDSESRRETLTSFYGSALAAAAKYLPIIKQQIKDAVDPINDIMSALDAE